MISTTVTTAALLAGALVLHADHVEKELLFHFAAGTHEIQNGAWQDKTHKATAQVVGALVRPRRPHRRTVVHGRGLSEPGQGARRRPKTAPRGEMTVTAWVRLDDTAERCGIISYLSDERSQSQGWMLGYNQRTFTFALSAGAGGDTQHRLTVIPSRSTIETGRWYYLAATYDGRTMRLYVNGELENESETQSGDIAYPTDASYLIGGCVHRGSMNLMEGSLFEAKCYARALAPAEIQAVAKKNETLIAWKPTPEKDLVFVVKPYLQFATTDSITVMCETSRPAKMRVEYAELQPLELSAAGESAQLISEVTLRGLKTATRYFYRVVCVDESGQEIRGPLMSFQTAVPETMPWAFAVIGDTQRNPEVTRKCAEGAFSKRPNFLLHCGDVVDDGFAKHQWVNDLFEPCSTLMAQIPTFPVIGNHEKDSHWYYDYFSLPKPEYYYTFRYGNSQFFMLDSNRPLVAGSPQYEWLAGELAKSKATWKFTCHHHPCFSSDENDYGDHHKGKPGDTFFFGDANARNVVPLYKKYGVDIAFNGHIHMYSAPGRSSRWRSINNGASATSPAAGGAAVSNRPRRTHLVQPALSTGVSLLLRRHQRSHDRFQGLRYRRTAV